MDYWIESSGETSYTVYGGDRCVVAQCTNMRDAALLVQAIRLLENISDKFPGLLNGEEEVTGSDLVADLTYEFLKAKTLTAYLKGQGGFQNDEELQKDEP